MQISHSKVYLFCLHLSEAVMLAALPKYKLRYKLSYLRWAKMTEILCFPIFILIDYLSTRIDNT